MIVIGFSANLPGRFGAPEQTIRAAADEMTRRGLRVQKMSRIWITAPVPVSNQPWYRNAVASIETVHDPRAVFKILKDIEHDFGRETRERNAARIIDMDIIAYNDLVLNNNDLTIPHPRMHMRSFVLCPLKDIAPDWVHPITGLGIDEMMKSVPADQVAKIMDEAA